MPQSIFCIMTSRLTNRTPRLSERIMHEDEFSDVSVSSFANFLLTGNSFQYGFDLVKSDIKYYPEDFRLETTAIEGRYSRTTFSGACILAITRQNPKNKRFDVVGEFEFSLYINIKTPKSVDCAFNNITLEGNVGKNNLEFLKKVGEAIASFTRRGNGILADTVISDMQDRLVNPLDHDSKSFVKNESTSQRLKRNNVSSVAPTKRKRL